MNIDLQKVIGSSLSLRIVASLARSLSPRLGYRIASGLADQVARQESSALIRALRLNQWIANRQTLQGDALDEIVWATLCYSAHSLFDLYHYGYDFEATRQLIVFDSSFAAIARRSQFEERGLIIAGLHLSNFDLVLQWLSKDGRKPLLITMPNPQGGRYIEYEVRKRAGMDVLPASVNALRQALKHLRGGGMVLTGIDRPVDKPEVCPRFFGYPAALPVHHIFLAIKAHVPVVMTATYLQPDGIYHVFASDPIEMDFCADATQGIIRNAEKVLLVAEEFIRRSPPQWIVPLPVWPQMTDLTP